MMLTWHIQRHLEATSELDYEKNQNQFQICPLVKIRRVVAQFSVGYSLKKNTTKYKNH